MSDKPDSTAAARSWTRIEDYLTSMRWRGAMRRRGVKTRLGHEAEPERLSLGLVPFLALIAGLAVIAVAIMIAAWPGGQKERRTEQRAPQEMGTAPPGWIDG